jgi:hypothetical protein
MSNLPRCRAVHLVLTYNGYSSSLESNSTTRADLRGYFSNSPLRPVANYVARRRLPQKIREQLHVVVGGHKQDTRILVVYGLGGDTEG